LSDCPTAALSSAAEGTYAEEPMKKENLKYIIYRNCIMMFLLAVFNLGLLIFITFNLRQASPFKIIAVLLFLLFAVMIYVYYIWVCKPYFETKKIMNELCRLQRKDAYESVKWCPSKINRILRNSTNKGIMAYDKSRSNNFLEQKRINNHDDESYTYMQGDFLPIN